jgi:SNF2 family DNA or RNA helicase
MNRVILSEGQMLRWADKDTLTTAEKYYEKGAISSLDISTSDIEGVKEGQIITLQSVVKAMDSFSNYNVKVEWDNIINHLRVKCSCLEQQSWYGRRGICEHTAAVLLTYIKDYQSSYTLNNKKSDIDELLQMLRENSEVEKEFKRELNLEVNFCFKDEYESSSSIELKLGLERPYVVRNMKNFAAALLKGECYEFGKNFTYNPALHKFNKIDEKLIEMIMEVKEMEGARSQSYNYYSPYSNSLFIDKKLLLTDKLVFRFFKLAQHRTINVFISRKEYNSVKILREPLPLEFQLSADKEVIELSQGGSLPKPLDDSKKVFWQDGAVYMPPNQQASVYIPIYNQLCRNRDKKLTIDRADGEKLAGYLLPKLKEVAEKVEIDETLRKVFHEAPLTIKVYLDKYDAFITAAVKYIYGEVKVDPFKAAAKESEKLIIIRDVTKEEHYESILEGLGFKRDKHCYVMRDELKVFSFISEGVAKLQQDGEVYCSNDFREMRVYSSAVLRGGVRLSEGELLEFSFELEGVPREELKDIFNALREKKKYFRLKMGSFINLEDRAIVELGNLFQYLGIKDRDLSKEKLLLPKYNALYLEQSLQDKEMDYVDRSIKFRELVKKVTDIKAEEYALPAHLEDVMRNYQRIGFQWFKTLSSYGFGGILADEMGLGKTLQTIAFLSSERAAVPSLVIVPTSLIYNWENEIKRFAPELKTVLVTGTKGEREELLRQTEGCDVIITSYPLIRRDIEEYENMVFNYCVLDEAQIIKNPASLNATAVKTLKARGYFALTGTPIENSLTELWSIFDFVMPGYLHSHHRFTNLYETPIIKHNDKAALVELNRRIKPFILRRLKKDVIKELPPKIEHQLVVDMTEEQKKLYAAYLSAAKQEIEEEIRIFGFSKSKMKIIAILTRMRQICCDPSVFIEDFEGENGKMNALEEILQECLEQGHRILVFSQFTTVLKNISKRLTGTGLQYLYLDGSTKSEERMALVDRFNSGETGVFLISLKAGGTGLNLTSADIVIHYDPWWNPAVEEQAADRAHRIGQKKTVQVIRLLSKGTIEEKIFNLQKKKKEMIQNIIGENMNEDNIIARMTQEDLEGLFA